MIVLDSNVLSALMLDRPPMAVVDWLDRQRPLSIWTSSITVFEMRFGLNSMPAGKHHAQRVTMFDRILTGIIEQRVVSFDQSAAEQTAMLAAARQRTGHVGELRDTMIAGIVLANHATLATRNARHFEDIKSSVVNPWEA